MTPVAEGFYKIPIFRFLSISDARHNGRVSQVFLDLAGLVFVFELYLKSAVNNVKRNTQDSPSSSPHAAHSCPRDTVTQTDKLWPFS